MFEFCVRLPSRLHFLSARKTERKQQRAGMLEQSGERTEERHTMLRCVAGVSVGRTIQPAVFRVTQAVRISIRLSPNPALLCVTQMWHEGQEEEVHLQEGHQQVPHVPAGVVLDVCLQVPLMHCERGVILALNCYLRKYKAARKARTHPGRRPLCS